MGLEVSISGGAELARLSRQLKDAGAKGLGREMGRALGDAAKPLERVVRAEAGAVMPHRGGYEQTLSRSLRFRLDRRTAAYSASLRFKTYADGTGERRDVPKLNDWVLRHPVFGRSRRIRRGRRAGTAQPNPWAVTTIRSGFWSRPVDAGRDDVAREMRKVLDDVADRLAGG